MAVQMPVTAYLGFGANLGDCEVTLSTVVAELGAHPQLLMTALSSLYQTAPVGLTQQPDFLNAVAAVQTTLSPQELLRAILDLEIYFGRVRTERWGPRVIDIDILLYGNAQIDEPGLVIPHPRLQERAFVLCPLAEIAPQLTLPQNPAALLEILRQLKDTERVQRLPSASWERLQRRFSLRNQ